MPATVERMSPMNPVRLRAERDAILDALRDVLFYDAPCDHEPDPVCCTHCHARALVARFTSEAA